VSLKPTPKSNLAYATVPGEQEFFGGAVRVVNPQVATAETTVETFAKSIVNILDGSSDGIHRLAFEVDPNIANIEAGLYIAKRRLIPDHVLKRIAIQDSLVATIVRTRQNHMSSFGRPRPDRYSKGYVIRPLPETLERLKKQSAEERAEYDKRIARAVKRFETCGSTEDVKDEERLTFAEWIGHSTRSAVVCGRVATEITYVGEGDSRTPHYWRHVDGGTVYRSAVDSEAAADSVRSTAYNTLCQLAGEKLPKEHRPRPGLANGFRATDYTWVQVIEGRPVQVFTSEELKVGNFYPVPDVELNGYPVTPLDTVITAVTTHLNIAAHNKLYFQSGRASRGMLVIKSEDATPQVISTIKQQFNASINSVNNSWRMPVFSCGTEEEITWQPIDAGGQRDAEFQYLTDMNAREILSAFMMSPDELPGWSYLSKGTNAQSLSESKGEYQLEAARDVGIRPLLAAFEDFINANLFPIVDAELARECRFVFVGLDAEDPEKEGVLLQTNSKLHLTYDDILEKVEKRPIGRTMGGEVPLNPDFHAMVMDPYLTVGEILEHFFGRENASKDPALAYRRDPFWMQWQQLQQQAQQQAQMAAQQPGPGGPQDGSPKGPPQGGGSPQGGGQDGAATADLARSVEAALGALRKSEDKLPANKRRLLRQADATVDFFLRGFLLDAKDALREVESVADSVAPRRRS